MLRKTILFLFAVALPASVLAAPESYKVDPFHSFPHFEVIHVGLAKIRGRFDKTEGTFTFDTAAKTGTAELTIHTVSVTTGDNDRGERKRTRDEHLRSPDFFNSTEFPTMTFKGAAVKWDGDSPKQLDGELTLLGVTKPLSLTVEQLKCGPDPRTKGQRYMCGVVATGSFKRSDFGMKFGLGGISDDVQLWIGVEAFRQ